MTNRFLDKLSAKLSDKGSLLCVGLDVDLSKIPERFKQEPNPLWAFNQYIIDQTADQVACYKPNMAFYEMQGIRGLEALQKTLEYIPQDIAVILDAKRGDIGNSSAAYAKAVFEELQADAVTLSPYMGRDSVVPFLEYDDRFSYLLCLTSNPGSQDFQKPELYQRVAKSISSWHNEFKNCGAVVGATNSTELQLLRELMPEIEFLIPGIGAQGGELATTIAKALATVKRPKILINSSRQIIYADNPQQEAAKLSAAIRHELQRKWIESCKRD